MIEKDESKISIVQLKELVASILSPTKKTTKFIIQLKEIIKHKDILFYTWKFFMKMVQTQKTGNHVFMLNALELLEIIKVPKNKSQEPESETLHLKNGPRKFKFDYSIVEKYIGKVWQSLINRDFNPQVHKKLLFVLLESYLSKIPNPIFLTDFLMTSMNIKGVVSVLALEGMAQLMQKHNIEYPNIYGKLYSMFEPDVFHSKYKSRLFYLADFFLTSSHLPEILVASFAKRVSRLSFLCSAPDTVINLRFIGNLLIRHPGLKKMIHHPCGREVPEDPFLDTETDPMKTMASSSSLWELSFLKNHCQPTVSTAAKFINFDLPSLEFDLAEVLNKSFSSMIEVEGKKKSKKICLTFERPSSTISQLKDDWTFKLWSLGS